MKIFLLLGRALGGLTVEELGFFLRNLFEADLSGKRIDQDYFKKKTFQLDHFIKHKVSWFLIC